MATYTLRPNADWDYASAFTISGGSGSAHAALADSSDATYITRTSTTVPASYYMELGTTTLAATERISSVNLRATFNIGTNGYVQFSLGVITDRNGRTVSYSVPVSKQKTTATGTYDLALNLTAAPNGAAWSQTYLDNLVVKFTDGATASADRAQLMQVYVDVETVNQPSLTVTAPSGTVTDTSLPSINWTYTANGGEVQSAYEIKIFDSATYGASGFNPNTSTTTVETGIQVSESNGQTLEVTLANNTTYRAYVRVAKLSGSSNYFSEWAYSQFTLSIDAPAEPNISAYFDTNAGAVTLTIYGRSNLLTENQASIETDTTGWTATTNCAIARSTAQHAVGSASLSITATAGGDAVVSTTIASATPVIVGAYFSAIAYFRANSTARNCSVGIRWLDSSSATLSTTYGTAVSDASGWVLASHYAVAPVNAAFAQVFIKIASCGAGEIHFLDKIAFHSGSSPVYTSGGFTDFAFDVERSSDSGVTWTTVRNSPVSANTSQIATLLDYEVPLDATVYYRAKARATV